MFNTEIYSQPIPRVLLASVDSFTDEFCSFSSRAVWEPKIFVTYYFIPKWFKHLNNLKQVFEFRSLSTHLKPCAWPSFSNAYSSVIKMCKKDDSCMSGDS